MTYLLFTLLFYCINTIQASACAKYTHHLMSYETYHTTKHTIPYMLELHNKQNQLFYFGANHSCDPNNEQFPLLADFWKTFLEKTKGENCVVLVEGSKRALRTNKIEAITTAGGEGGLLTFLAHQQNIPIICPEPTDGELYTKLLEEYEPEQIAYRIFAILGLQAIRYKKARRNFDALAWIHNGLKRYQDFLAFPLSIKTMETIHASLFSHALDLNDEAFFYNITNPATQDTIINKVCRSASILRDQHIVATIENLLKEDKHIFIAYGATHAVMQEAALRDIFFDS